MDKLKYLFYITHKNNLKSILRMGLLSRNKIENDIWTKKNGVIQICNKDIIEERKKKKFRGRSLWDYVNVYFQPRNAMLYDIIKNKKEVVVVVLQIKSDILNTFGAGITDGNANANKTSFFENIDKGLSSLDPDIFDKGKKYWNDIDDGRRKFMSEALIPDRIPKENILGIFTATQKIADQIKEDQDIRLKITPNDNLFFSHKDNKFSA